MLDVASMSSFLCKNINPWPMKWKVKTPLLTEVLLDRDSLAAFHWMMSWDNNYGLNRRRSWLTHTGASWLPTWWSTSIHLCLGFTNHTSIPFPPLNHTFPYFSLRPLSSIMHTHTSPPRKNGRFQPSVRLFPSLPHFQGVDNNNQISDMSHQSWKWKLKPSPPRSVRWAHSRTPSVFLP